MILYAAQLYNKRQHFYSIKNEKLIDKLSIRQNWLKMGKCGNIFILSFISSLKNMLFDLMIMKSTHI